MKSDEDRSRRKEGLLARVMSSLNFMVSDQISTRDQRRSARLNCGYAVSFVDEFGSKGTGTLVDISKSGLQLETPTRLRKGVTLAVQAPEDEQLDRTAPFMAKVRWVRKGEAGNFRIGLALPPGVEDDPHWLEALLHQLGYCEEEGQRREYIRAISEIAGRLTPAGGSAPDDTTIDVTILNLGSGGALLKSQVPLDKNDQFHLAIGPYEDLPEIKLFGSILRVVEKPDHVLYPSRFRATEERDEKILQEYILKLSGMDS